MNKPRYVDSVSKALKSAKYRVSPRWWPPCLNGWYIIKLDDPNLSFEIHACVSPTLDMSILHSIFSFRTSSTTTLASLFYFVIFISLYRTQNGPSVPSVQKQHALGLDVEHAYRDLHLVSLPSRAVCSTYRGLILDRRASSPLQFPSKRYRARFLARTTARNSERTRFYPRRGWCPHERGIRGFRDRKQHKSHVFSGKEYSRESWRCWRWD